MLISYQPSHEPVAPVQVIEFPPAVNRPEKTVESTFQDYNHIPQAAVIGHQKSTEMENKQAEPNSKRRPICPCMGWYLIQSRVYWMEHNNRGWRTHRASER